MSSANEARRDVRCALPKNLPTRAALWRAGSAKRQESALKRREYTTGDPGGIAQEK